MSVVLSFYITIITIPCSTSFNVGCAFYFFSVHPYTYVDVYIYSHNIQLTIIVKYILLELTFLNDLASVNAEFQGVDDHAMVERAVDVFPHLKSTVAGLLLLGIILIYWSGGA